LIDAALMNHFPDVGGRRIETLPDPVNRQPAAAGLSSQCRNGKSKVLRRIP
jgi:hypothetical protein